jgi:hypothetical protein
MHSHLFLAASILLASAGCSSSSSPAAGSSSQDGGEAGTSATRFCCQGSGDAGCQCHGTLDDTQVNCWQDVSGSGDCDCNQAFTGPVGWEMTESCSGGGQVYCCLIYGDCSCDSLNAPNCDGIGKAVPYCDVATTIAPYCDGETPVSACQ